ncbi:outer membrane efflux protein [Thermodesulfitimonas autotrophica]|uniref:Outer membrane efflux protein n=1 Tax=Thermodesulfitimonas autotrophica TaxID=1894989 RepID=A0A3N5BF36_9THEO|nr:TolC family protein [Thermodesulfitimonas autotrophica]RPF42651.1 outer membrane efflux protein [Thermodesulfitimonas autotrophica]
MWKRVCGMLGSLLVVVMLTLPAVAAEKEKAPVKLSMAEAVFRALCFSKSVEKAQLDLDKAESTRLSAAGAVQPQWYTTYTPGTEPLLFAKESADFGWRGARQNYELARDTVVLDVYNRYYAVLRAQEKVAAKEAALKPLEKKLAVTQAMVRAGVATRIALKGLEAQLAGAKAALAATQGELNDAYVAFNQLVGLPPEERPVLTDTVSFAPFTATENDCVSWATGNNPTVWIARYAAEYKRAVQNYDTGNPATVVTEEDARKAELDAESAEEAATLLGRKLYTGIRSLEEAYAAAQEAVATAAENLRLARVRLAAGAGTPAEVTAAEADLAAARQSLLDLTVQHAYMKLAAAKPWAYLGVLAASGSGTAAAGK